MGTTHVKSLQGRCEPQGFKLYLALAEIYVGIVTETS